MDLVFQEKDFQLAINSTAPVTKEELEEIYTKIENYFRTENAE